MPRTAKIRSPHPQNRHTAPSRLPPWGGTCASIQRGHQVFTLEWIHSSMQLSSVVSGLFYLAINKFKTRYMKTS